MSIFGSLTGLDNFINDIPAITPAQNLFQSAGLSNTDLLTLGAGAGAAAGGGFGDFSLGSLFDGAGAGGLGGLFGSSGLNTNSLLGAAPILAAIQYARNQGPFDTSRLSSLYDRFDPSALASEYDINTGRGRNALTSSLMDRGVYGSSFGNMDLTNYNTSRELGRNNLINQGIGVAGGLANDILNSQIKQRALQNDLYGRSLLALGNIFSNRGNGVPQATTTSRNPFSGLLGDFLGGLNIG